MTLPFSISRREMLVRSGTGLGILGLAGMLHAEAPVANAPGSPLAPKSPHFPAKAKHVIHLFMNGGPSQVDTFDPKPELAKRHGERVELKTGRKPGPLMK